MSFAPDVSPLAWRSRAWAASPVPFLHIRNVIRCGQWASIGSIAHANGIALAIAALSGRFAAWVSTWNPPRRSSRACWQMSAGPMRAHRRARSPGSESITPNCVSSPRRRCCKAILPRRRNRCGRAAARRIRCLAAPVPRLAAGAARPGSPPAAGRRRDLLWHHEPSGRRVCHTRVGRKAPFWRRCLDINPAIART